MFLAPSTALIPQHHYGMVFQYNFDLENKGKGDGTYLDGGMDPSPWSWLSLAKVLTLAKVHCQSVTKENKCLCTSYFGIVFVCIPAMLTVFGVFQSHERNLAVPQWVRQPLPVPHGLVCTLPRWTGWIGDMLGNHDWLSSLKIKSKTIFLSVTKITALASNPVLHPWAER